MKQTRRLSHGLLACAIAVAMVSSVAAQTASEGAATVVRIKGPARYTTGQNIWKPLKVGTVLTPGSLVQTSTERGSYVDLALGEGSAPAPVPSPVAYRPSIPNSMNNNTSSYQPSAAQDAVRVWENTALGIDKLSSVQTGADRVSETQLDLKAGHISGSVKKLSGASKYEIKLPNGVAGIRGTVYDITSDGIVRVLVGSVVLAWVDPKTGNVTTQVVTGGQQYNASTNQVSPIPSSEVSWMDKLVASMRTSSGAGPVVPQTYVSDRTIQYVSPVVNGTSFSSPGAVPVIPPGHGQGL